MAPAQESLRLGDELVAFKSLGITEDEIKKFEGLGIRYSKADRRIYKEMSSTPPPTPDDVDRLGLFGGSVPAAYKDFLVQHNGGKPTPNVVEKDGRRLVLNVLLAAKSPPRFYDSIQNHLEVYRNRIPKSMIPIGSSPNGDLFLMSSKSDSLGRIYYWEHEQATTTTM